MPHWGFGLCGYQFLADGRLLCNYTEQNESHLAFLANGQLEEIDLPFSQRLP